MELYDLIGKYLPKRSGEEHILDFIGKIVDNVVEAKSTAYIEAICLMTKRSVSEIVELPSERRLELFSIGLITNGIFDLDKFCKDINYASTI